MPTFDSATPHTVSWCDSKVMRISHPALGLASSACLLKVDRIALYLRKVFKVLSMQIMSPISKYAIDDIT